MDINIVMNKINAELLVEVLENKVLAVLGEQSTDEIISNIKDAMRISDEKV